MTDPSSTTVLTKGELMRGVIPYLAIERAAEAVDFFKRAFGACVLGDPALDDRGMILNASLRINDGVLMVMDHQAERGHPPARTGQGFTLQLVVRDGDAWWSRAVAAGCAIVEPFETQIWGDRYGRLKDPFGFDWAIVEPSAKHIAAADQKET